MKKLLGILFLGTTGLLNLNAQTTDGKINLQLQEEPPVTKKKQVSDDDVDIWKFNALGSVFKGFDIAYERKIAPKWSLNFNSVTGFGGGGTSPGYVLRNMNINQSLAVQLRYYHNLDRRKRLGKSTHFSGNYFALEVKGGINSYNGNYYWYGGPGERQNNVLSSISLLYGIQRKVGKRAYIDGSIGLGLGHIKTQYYSGFLLQPTLKLGVGLTF